MIWRRNTRRGWTRARFKVKTIFIETCLTKDELVEEVLSQRRRETRETARFARMRSRRRKRDGDDGSMSIRNCTSRFRMTDRRMIYPT